MPSGPNPILASDNTQLSVSNLAIMGGNTSTLSGIPLTTANGTATGQVVVGVAILGGSATVTTAQRQYTTVSTSTPVTANGNAFTIAAGTIGCVQNCKDEVLFVKLGTGASATSFNWILRAGDAADDGKGGSIIIDNWVGIVSIFAVSTAPRASAFLLS